MPSFYIHLLLLTAIMGALNMLFSFQPFYHPLVNFGWAGIVFYAMLSALLYEVNRIASRSSAPGSVMRFFYIGFILKFFSSLLFISYFIFVDPIGTDLFLLPFFVLYMGHTLLLSMHTLRLGKKIPNS
jgi:hypothetical protein